MKVRPVFAWYDIWVGVFIDRPKRRIYIFPIPCFGVLIERKPEPAPKRATWPGEGWDVVDDPAYSAFSIWVVFDQDETQLRPARRAADGVIRMGGQSDVTGIIDHTELRTLDGRTTEIVAYWNTKCVVAGDWLSYDFAALDVAAAMERAS